MSERANMVAAERGSSMRRFLVITGLLLLVLPVTWGARSWYLDQVGESIDARQRTEITDALNEIEARFGELQRALIERARRVAEDPAVIRGLRTRARQDLALGPEELISYFVALDVPQRSSVELYDFRTQLVAWNGFSMPLDDAPLSERFPGSFLTSIAQDEAVRQALVVWWPVREGRTVLGAVRAMRLIQFDAPVRNEHLRDVSLEDRWERQTRLKVTAEFDPSAIAEGEVQQRSRLLEGADGKVLGRVTVERPTPEQIVSAARERFDHVVVFWVTLLSFWFMGGLWAWYRRSVRLSPQRVRSGRLWYLLAQFVVVGAGWWILRYVLLRLDVPARWQRGKAPLSPLFDPMHLASGLGEGLLQSTGDMLVTGLFLIVFAVAFCELTAGFRRRAALLWSRRHRGAARDGSLRGPLIAVLIASVVITLLTIVLALVTQRLVLDSTLDFFARRGLLPEPLLLVVFCAFLLIAAAVIMIAVGLVWIVISQIVENWPRGRSRRMFWAAVGGTAALPLILVYGATDVHVLLPWSSALSFLIVPIGLAAYLMVRRGRALEMLILRSILPTAFVITLILYPLLYNGMDTQRRIEMIDAAETFAEGRDPRVLFSMEQILQDLRQERRTRELLAQASSRDTRLDSLAMASVRGTLLASLPAFDVSLTFLSHDGQPVGRYYDSGHAVDTQTLNELDALEFDIIREMYEEAGATGVMVEQVTGRREPDRLQYEGIAAVSDGPSGDVMGWIMVRAEPRLVLREGGTPFPRVLLPSGSYDDLYANLSVAEFRGGVLVRSAGRDFGRFRLPEAVQQAVAAEPEVWRNDLVDDREYRTYYRRIEPDLGAELAPLFAPTSGASVVAVRVPAVHTFDHLYYLLRLTVAGLFIVLPLYLVGLVLRRRAGLLPAPRVRFRDKVLNAFLVVGIIAVGAVGWIGLQVVTGENQRAIQSWLRQHLDRIEETLSLETRGEEMPYRALERTRIDSLAARIRLDLNVYEGYELTALSRPQLLRERLIDRRLPIEAFHALYFEGYRFIHTDERVGDFMYSTGYRALPDEQGRPRFVISVPTLPEQEQIEEERARTVAYLFGALLLLVLLVMFTASVLANAISRPIARLRSGLKAVAAGHFERMLPVDSRDEIGDLVQTFNEMQDQLAESRRRLAQQERQLAWREMARQVAHEIKNPLTPMKLSVQHLRRAFENDGTDPRQKARFRSLFDRITTTLIEQIDTLARIANEFHSFARMPSRILEKLDLNAVIEEAVALMQEEESMVEIELALHPEPIIVEADREELRRNYINLIKNAIQAIPEQQRGRIEVSTSLEHMNGSTWAHSSVADNGTGVLEEARDRIFEPNFSTKTSGAGLGLAIVKKSVEELQGEIGFDTVEGEGSTFWIRLPLGE